MTVYVDALIDWGWVMYGRTVASCHMFTDAQDLQELHAMAKNIGLKRSHFQDHPDHPHYDLVSSKRAAAIRMGVMPVSCREAAIIIRRRNNGKDDPDGPEGTLRHSGAWRDGPPEQQRDEETAHTQAPADV